jgi:hypothetical protein
MNTQSNEERTAGQGDTIVMQLRNDSNGGQGTIKTQPEKPVMTVPVNPPVKNSAVSVNDNDWVARNYQILLEQEKKTNKRFPFEKKDFNIITHQKTDQINFDNHYLYHTAWAARVVQKINPVKHVDISSYTYFATILSAFIPVDYYDYRMLPVTLDQLHCGTADLYQLPFENNSIASLSCMHVVEHVGLGRYGDNPCYDGDLKAFQELSRVLAVNGDLLFVVPIGKPKIVYNAHRIYSYDQIISAFSGLQLLEFSLISDDKYHGMLKNPDVSVVNSQSYGCGCFWFKKH